MYKLPPFENPETRLMCPINMEWIMPEKVLRRKHRIWKSPVIEAPNIPGVSYFLNFDITKSWDGNAIVWFNVNTGTKKEIGVRVKIMIGPSFHHISKDWKQSKFVKKQLVTYKVELCKTRTLINGEQGHQELNFDYVIRCKGFIFAKEHNSLNIWRFNAGKADLHNMWKQNNDKNVAIFAKDAKLIMAHSSVLEARSDFWKTYLPTLPNPELCVITEFPSETVLIGIMLTYDFNLLPPLTLKQKMGLLKYLNVYPTNYDYKGALENHLIQLISTARACELLHCSIAANCTKLKTECINFLKKCVQETIPVHNAHFVSAKLRLEIMDKANWQESETL